MMPEPPELRSGGAPQKTRPGVGTPETSEAHGTPETSDVRGTPETSEVRGTPETVGAAPEFTIAYQDEHLLVVDKPAGLVVHPARGHREGTLSQLLAGVAAGGELERAGIVHRLDRDTSGLLVVARTEEAHRLLQDALRKRLIEREYVALVEGLPPARTGTIEAPIGRHPRIRTRMAVGGTASREARTHFTLERSLGNVSLLRLRLDTGRTHQIRVHLQAIGHPVCGDPEYGTGGRDSILGLQRQFLHATRLAFPHPLSGEPIEIVSPLPKDLREALGRAEAASGR
jgi:23S rRNA pseudouridine1911/1915/1917 synthase